MNNASEMIRAIQVFQEAHRKEQAARAVLSDRLLDHLRVVAMQQMGNSPPMAYDASDLRQSVVRLLVENDFRELATMNVENENQVKNYFRRMVRNKLVDTIRILGAGKRGREQTTSCGDADGELVDQYAANPDALLIREEDLARWRAMKELLSADDRRLIDLVESFWQQGADPDWVRIAGLLCEIGSEARRLRCYRIRRNFSDSHEGPEGSPTGPGASGE